MIVIADVLAISGYVLGAFLMGYASSYLFYVFRRVAWLSAR